MRDMIFFRNKYGLMLIVLACAVGAGCGGAIQNASSGGSNTASPTATLSSANVTFPNAALLGTSTALAVILTNSGKADLAISSIAVTGDFTQTNDCGSSLAAGSSCTVNITFTPTVTGSLTGTLVITDSAPGSPEIVSLSGTGVDAVVPSPAASLSPAVYSFGSQVLNTTSSPQIFTLANAGTASLAISSVAIIGDFAQTNTCGTTLAANSRCSLSVSFTPTATGSRTGALIVTDNATGSPHQISLSGTGTNPPAPVVGLSITSLGFGSQVLNTTSVSQTVTLSNTGNASLNISSVVITGDFAQTNTCGATVAANSSCNLNVTFTPTAIGSRNGTLTITDSAAGSPTVVSLSGTGAAPAPGLSASSLTFGSQPLNTTSSAQSVTFSNTGNAGLAISSVVITGDFVQSNNCGSTLAANSSCSFYVTFTPTAIGSRNGTLTITDNAAGSPYVVTLTGTGLAPTAGLSVNSLTFGSQLLSTSSSAQTVTLTNSGNASLAISSVAITGDFAQTNTCGTALAANSSCSLNVTFTPTAAGSRAGTLTITDDAATSPNVVSLTGTGVAPTAGLSSNSLTFGSQLLSTSSSAQTVKLTNSGNASLAISSVAITGDFAQTNTCGAALAANSSCSLNVTFTPTATGSRAGTLTITDNAATSPSVVSLTGIGAAPSAGLSVSSLTFGSQTVNTTSADQTVTLTNSGNASLTISSVAITGDFAQTNTCGATLAANSSCSLNVTFTPTATGSRAGTLTITDSAATSPNVVSLTGAGVTPGQLSVSSSSIAFGSVAVDQISTQPVGVTNVGGTSVTISSASTSGAGFGIAGLSLPMVIEPQQSTTFSVSFSPSSTGADSGDVYLTNDGTVSPLTIPLTGTGTSAPLHSAGLSWEASTSSDVVGYYVYRGEQSGGPYTQITVTAVIGTAYTDATVAGGITYYYVLTAVDNTGTQSGYSNETVAAIPTP